MIPIVNTVSDSYRIQAVDGLNEVRPFGKDMTFRVKLKQLVKKR